jgi:hypothetical protein
MARRLGRRSIFFAVTAFVCLALVPAAPSEFRWVVWFTAGLAAFWAIMVGAEDLLTPGRRPEPSAGPAPESPFAPPPPPQL